MSLGTGTSIKTITLLFKEPDMVTIASCFQSTKPSIKQQNSKLEFSQVVEYKYITKTRETQLIVKNNIQSKTESLGVKAIIIHLWNKYL